MKKLIAKRTQLLLDLTHPSSKPGFLKDLLTYNNESLCSFFQIFSGSREDNPFYKLNILSVERFLGLKQLQNYEQESITSENGNWIFGEEEFYLDSEEESYMERCKKAKALFSNFCDMSVNLSTGIDFIKVDRIGVIQFDPSIDGFFYENEEQILKSIENRIGDSSGTDRQNNVVFISENPITITFVKSIRKSYPNLHIINTKGLTIEKIDQEKLDVLPKPEKRDTRSNSKGNFQVA